jgi:formylglycine-generating enzyme required for sulfatase activity
MEGTMRRSLSIFTFVIVASVLAGCILSKTPSSDEVAIDPGDQLTFKVTVFPPATYTWTLDGTSLSNTAKSYVYTASLGIHTLTVRATHFLGTDTQTWNIQSLPVPVSQILSSLVTIPAGSFIMGSIDNEYGTAHNTTPVHQVTLQSFDIGKYEVTQAQYEAVMGTNPSWYQESNGYQGSDNRPVEYVTWYWARQFCTALSAMTGRTFTLPSEAQWEYACRAGTTTLYSWGDSDSLIGDYEWWWYNSDGIGGPYATHPVGTKLPNAWGLYDMHGNVLEWCLDSWHPNYTDAPVDGSAWEPDSGTARMLRGGGWNNGDVWCLRSATRFPSEPDYRGGADGFRVVAVR